MGLALGAELFQLQTVRIVAAILLGDVVTLFALSAGERDLRTNVPALLGHVNSSFCQ